MRRRGPRLAVPTVISNEEADRLIAERRANAKVDKAERVRQEIEEARDRILVMATRVPIHGKRNMVT